MKFLVYSQNELVYTLQDGPRTSHCISITNPGEITPDIVKRSYNGLLELKFCDSDNSPVTASKVTKEDVEKIIDFYDDNATGFSVHCQRGIARSTAAMLCLMYLYYKDESKAVERLKQIRPLARPLEALLDIFDEITGSDFSFVKELNKAINFYNPII